jgi:cystathionine beta-lyase
MWVADMNFATVPTIVSEISERLKHPHFGYFMKRDEYYDSIISWQEKRK